MVLRSLGALAVALLMHRTNQLGIQAPGCVVCFPLECACSSHVYSRTKWRLSALETMEFQGGKYDLQTDYDLYAFTAPLASRPRRQLAPRTVVVKDLRPGMVLTSDIYTNDGVLVVSTGTKISLIILEKLYNFPKMPDIKESYFYRAIVFFRREFQIGIPHILPLQLTGRNSKVKFPAPL